MAALTTLTLNQKQLLANSLQAAATAVYREVQNGPTGFQATTTAVLAAAKVLLDSAQG